MAEREKTKNSVKNNALTRETKWDKFQKLALKKHPNLKLLKKDYIFDLSYE